MLKSGWAAFGLRTARGSTGGAAATPALSSGRQRPSAPSRRHLDLLLTGPSRRHHGMRGGGAQDQEEAGQDDSQRWGEEGRVWGIEVRGNMGYCGLLSLGAEGAVVDLKEAWKEVSGTCVGLLYPCLS